MSNELPPLPPPPDQGNFPPLPPPPGGGSYGSGGGASWPPPPGDGGFGGGGLPPANQGIPWENSNEGLFTRAWKTVKMVLFEPVQFFEAMPTTGGQAEPLKFALILGCAGALLGLLCQLPFNGLQIIAQLSNSNSQSEPVGAVVGIVIGMCVGVVCVPVFLMIYTYIMSGLFHLCLSLFGAASQGFEGTFRVVAYVQGAMAIPNAIPCLNCFTGIYALVLFGLGFMKVHKCEAWQAVLAVLIPLVLCVGGVIAIYFAIIAVVVANM